MLESLFNKVAGLEACSFIKKRLQHICFPVNIVKFLRIVFFIEHLWWMSFGIHDLTSLSGHEQICFSRLSFRRYFSHLPKNVCEML